ncbi:MAG TPA: alcohol dehydrogenase catalytic domain-containing protein [Nonomuraea sp.]|nr:alcohol dehydrogenase catalytic domain-containing protein [Nonomuraea sp.]
MRALVLTGPALRPGHEWCGRVTAVGEGVDGDWLGRRVTGDTMLSRRQCGRCRSGRHHACGDLAEMRHQLRR